MNRIELGLLAALCAAGCGDSSTNVVSDVDSGAEDSGNAPAQGKDPDTAEVVEVDRFSEAAGMLMVRDGDNGLPEANEAVDFDQGPFITEGLGPRGQKVAYYNFDVQSTTPAPIYVFFEEGAEAPIDTQLNVIDVIPGDDGYSDFWQVVKVTVPDDYVPNAITSEQGILDAELAMEETDMLVNCPVVPEGSTATKRLGDADAEPHRGWYKDKLVFYFDFEEAPLKAAGGKVPTSPIYVTFNENPPEGGPASGFMSETGSNQTHNVVATVPGDPGYSPLWSVAVYDNADFDAVSDLSSALSTNVLATGVANVNCPVVSVE